MVLANGLFLLFLSFVSFLKFVWKRTRLLKQREKTLKPSSLAVFRSRVAESGSNDPPGPYRRQSPRATWPPEETQFTFLDKQF